MTAATATESDAVRQAWTAYYRVRRTGWPATRPDIISALDGLRASLETFEAILGGVIHPAAAYPGWHRLEHDPEALNLALGRAVTDAGEWARLLDELVPAKQAMAA